MPKDTYVKRITKGIRGRHAIPKKQRKDVVELMRSDANMLEHDSPEIADAMDAAADFLEAYDG